MQVVDPLFSKLESTARFESDTAGIADDFNSFLNLLTVQLQNQDPLEPLDTNQFTEQIVNMTAVEQSVSMNQRLGALIEAQETQRIQTAVDFVGLQADALGDIAPLGPDGAEMFYTLTRPAESIRVEFIDPEINDPFRSIVRTVENPSPRTGLHRVSWDGLDNDGVPVDPNKTYRMRVTALSAQGQALESEIGFSGIAEELRHTDGALTLTIAGRPVSLESIVATRTPTAKPAQAN